MSTEIKGITKKAFLRAWKEIRKELSRSSIRDVVDFIEYDIDPDMWINSLLARIKYGKYEPSSPNKFTIAKSKGLSRRMTMPLIPDLVLFRTIVDFLYLKTKGREHKHVYFERKDLEQERQNAEREIERSETESDTYTDQTCQDVLDYESGSDKRFRAWLHYDQYRKYLIFRRVHSFIVLTDITNFFDSVLFSRVADSLHEVAAPSGMVDLLFLLLERLGNRQGLKESPHIGLPVDEFDCSRKLAHMILYPHDDRIVDLVSEERYIRWMDDQVIGAESRADALSILNKVDSSLATLHLTANSGKSEILTINGARRHFHLDVNRQLDEIEKVVKGGANRTVLARMVRDCWTNAKQYKGIGEWEKILKRLYRLAGIAQLRSFRRRASEDIHRYPRLAQRIFAYMAAVNDVSEYLDFALEIISDQEQIYGDVNRLLIESMLRLEPNATERHVLWKLARDLLQNKIPAPGKESCCIPATLMILRYGDKRSLPTLLKLFEKNREHEPTDVARACAIVYASYGPGQYLKVRQVASRLFQNYLSGMVRMLEKIKKYDRVPNRFSVRLWIRYDSVSNRKYIDMRTLLAERLLALNRKKKVEKWLSSKKLNILDQVSSTYDKALIDRLWIP